MTGNIAFDASGDSREGGVTSTSSMPESGSPALKHSASVPNAARRAVLGDVISHGLSAAPAPEVASQRRTLQTRGETRMKYRLVALPCSVLVHPAVSRKLKLGVAAPSSQAHLARDIGGVRLAIRGVQPGVTSTRQEGPVRRAGRG